MGPISGGFPPLHSRTCFRDTSSLVVSTSSRISARHFCRTSPIPSLVSPVEIRQPQDEWHFASHQTGMVGLVKQLFDHVMAPIAQGKYSAYAIERC